MGEKVTRYASRNRVVPTCVTGKIIAIVPTAGWGRRFGTSRKKPFVGLLGIPLLIHTLRRLHSVSSITEIIPVLREEDIEKGLKLVRGYKLNKVKHVVSGGKERQDSVYNALCLIAKGSYREDFPISQGKTLILIHDGVRPLVTTQLIEKILTEIYNEGNNIDGVVPGIPLKETLKEVGGDGFVISTKSRERFWVIQTPQVFRFNVLKKAYDEAYKDGFYATDDSALVERVSGRVKVISGDPFNIKVTTPEDMEMVKYLLAKRGVSEQ